MNKNIIKRASAAVIVIAAAFALSACTEDARAKDEKTSEKILADLQKAQPVPQFPYSQIRQNLIEVITAQAEATATTSFFFNQGVERPIMSCPSIGFPIASTTQLTNPDQLISGSSGAVISQVEPTGTFTGDSTGTHVICRDADGRGYDVYWEGFVGAVTGPAIWSENGIELIGAPTASFSTGE